MRSEVTVTSQHILTWGLVGEFRCDVCRGASAHDELHEVILVFPFRLLSLKQRRQQEVPSHSVVLLQRHLLPVCVDPEDVFHCSAVMWLWFFSSWIKWIWLEVGVSGGGRFSVRPPCYITRPLLLHGGVCWDVTSPPRAEGGRRGGTETPSLCPLGAPERLQEVLKYLRSDAARLWWSRCSCWWRSCCCIQISHQVFCSWVVKGAFVKNKRTEFNLVPAPSVRTQQMCVTWDQLTELAAVSGSAASVSHLQILVIKYRSHKTPD